MVGGRALEEEEEGAEELAPLAGNFAFYHTKPVSTLRAPQPRRRAPSVLEVGGLQRSPGPSRGGRWTAGGPCEPLCLQPQP